MHEVCDSTVKRHLTFLWTEAAQGESRIEIMPELNLEERQAGLTCRGPCRQVCSPQNKSHGQASPYTEEENSPSFFQIYFQIHLPK